MSHIEELDFIIYHHLGMGDHIVCNGLLRHINLHNLNKKIGLVVKNKNKKNVDRMYDNAVDIIPIGFEDDLDFTNYCDKNNIKTSVIKLGFNKMQGNFDSSFYNCANVPFKERWECWSLRRDLQQEERITKELNIQGDYIFVHDSYSGGKFNINIKSQLPQITPRFLKCEQSIFDWIGVMERAKEIHCVNSSFIHIANSYNFNNKKYYHNLRRGGNLNFSLTNDWETIKY
tara:strand:+ start:267 stop:956 length:690 start_codon:yes stop_codon:yes gene_type:complete